MDMKLDMNPNDSISFISATVTSILFPAFPSLRPPRRGDLRSGYSSWGGDTGDRRSRSPKNYNRYADPPVWEDAEKERQEIGWK